MMNLNLLAHAQLIELEIGSQCGGFGKCAGDRVFLAESDRQKVNPPTEAELHWLTPGQLASGMRLACQCFPNQDGDDLLVSCV